MKSNDILRRAPTAMRPILQVVLERVDELEVTVSKQGKQIAALKKIATTPATPKPEKAPKQEEKAEEEKAEAKAEEPEAEA